MGQGLLWIGHWPRWRRSIPNFMSMWKACRSDGRPWWARIVPAIRNALAPLSPMPVGLFWGRITLYSWGWSLDWGTGWMTWSRDSGLYWSPDGTPSNPAAVSYWTPRAHHRDRWSVIRTFRE
jgi:hypothetical protein